jgi:hypothetical protein
MTCYAASPAYQFWLHVERPALVNRVAYYNARVGFPNTLAVLARDPHMTRARLDAAWHHDALALNRARAHLALGNRLHLAHLQRLHTDILADVAAQYAALGPIGADPGKGPFLDGLPVFAPLNFS